MGWVLATEGLARGRSAVRLSAVAVPGACLAEFVRAMFHAPKSKVTRRPTRILGIRTVCGSEGASYFSSLVLREGSIQAFEFLLRPLHPALRQRSRALLEASNGSGALNHSQERRVFARICGTLILPGRLYLP